MLDNAHATPSNYRGPQTSFERDLCRRIFGLVVSDPRIAINFGHGIVLGDTARADLVLAAPRFWATLKVILTPGLSIGETYAGGEWYLQKGYLADFLFVMRNQAPKFYDTYYRFVSQFKGIRHYFQQYIFPRYFTRKVREHYDFDSQAYEMILGPSMVYTCGFFSGEHFSLEQAQDEKIRTVISRLRLREDAIQILDLGCGWGALDRAIVQEYPLAKICASSISGNQISWARERTALALPESQASRIEFLVEDYAVHPRFGVYDTVVVLGMLEHVGLGDYTQFFKLIEKLLKPGGTALVHTVVAPLSGQPSNRWINRRIFVGGYIPSLAEIARSVESSALSLTEIYLHSPKHYRKTIETWTQNLIANRTPFVAHLVAKGAAAEEAEKAFRTWHFYLSAVRNLFEPNAPHSDQIVHICLNKKP